MAVATKEISLVELRKEVQKVLAEHWQKENSVEVIVTYDCIETDFRNKLRDDLLVGHYQAVPLSESTYRLPRKLSPKELDVLASEIIDIFEEVINESKQPAPNSVVRLIIPNGKEFQVFNVILKK